MSSSESTLDSFYSATGIDATGIDTSTGLSTSDQGVLAIKGDGNLAFAAVATPIDIRAQGDLVWRDDSNAVYLEYGASDLNSHLNAYATFSNEDDRWNSTDSDKVSANGNDVDLHLPFDDTIKAYYSSSITGTGATYIVPDDCRNFYTNFESDLRTSFLLGGGEVLFTDETLSTLEVTPTVMKNMITSASTTGTLTGPSILGSEDNVTSGSGDSGTVEGSTTITFTETVLKILQLNRVLRTMMDIGYNGRDASGSGMATGNGSDGFINANPFIANDLIFIPEGLTLSAKVNIDAENKESPSQLEDSSSGNITVTSRDYEKSDTFDLIIKLV